MAKKISYEEFLKRAREVWGVQYDYNQPENFHYRKQLVEITCPEHGPFWKIPSDHIFSGKNRKPSGCPDCSSEAVRKAKMKPFVTFIEDARTVHGDKYKYVEDTYDGARKNTEIICPDHGSFHQTPDAHINQKQGCPFCANEETGKRNVQIGLKNAKKKLKEITSGKVKLVDESYVEQREEAHFVCIEHGEYSRIVIQALTSVYPCKECGGDKANNEKFSKQQIYEKISEHKGNFNIIEILGEGRDAEVKVECFDCDIGVYLTSVGKSDRHEILCGNCRRIASEPYRKAMAKKFYDDRLQERIDWWLSRFYEKWGDLYDYSEMDFKSASQPIKVICNKPYHPPFYPTPDGHLKSGCRLCANEQLAGKYTDKYFQLFPEQTNIEGWLYYLELKYSGQIFYKVGITKNNIKTRHAMLNVIEELEWRILGEKNTTLFEAFQSEQEIQRDHGDKSRQELPIDSEEVRRCRVGPSECFFESLSIADFEKYFG